MTDMIFACKNGRDIPKEDKIFGISNRAKAMIQKEGKENVVNGTIGALLDDEGKLIVLSSVNDVFKTLNKVEYAEYTPISGTPGFREAVKKDLFRRFTPTSHVRAVATPGGTGAIKNTISNYTSRGDKILIADWYWAPYKTIAQEQERNVETFELFNEENVFNCASFERKVNELLEVQERLVVILNTPSHNPTGYALSADDWNDVIRVLSAVDSDKKVTLLVDAAYVDFAGDEEESRMFLPFLEKLPENVLPIVGHSLSKAYTLYGMRCGAMICMAKSEAVAEEFKRVCEFSSRGSWSNCTRAPQMILEKIFADHELLDKVIVERKGYRDMLIRRGETFKKAAEEAELEMVPFRAGFFAAIPCTNPDAIASELEKEAIFTVPLAKGVRVSLASISEAQAKALPAKIKAVMNRIK